MIKPMLAEDYDPTKLKFRLGLMPKIDGVRGFNSDGILKGRSLKKHENKYVTELFSKEIYRGFDGELAAGFQRGPDLCRITSSALSTIDSKPFIHWHLFDYITEKTKHLDYFDRFQALGERVDEIIRCDPVAASYLTVVPMLIIANIDELNAQHKAFIDMGYEGSIIRDLKGMYKEGRSTVNEGGLLRIKDFAIDEAIVISIVEGKENNNIKTVNELGRDTRSSHKANKKPNGMVGALVCKDIKTGLPIMVGAGKMDHTTRGLFFENPELIVNKIIKYKHFPKGVKDRPRFPTFESIRIASDIDKELLNAKKKQ